MDSDEKQNIVVKKGDETQQEQELLQDRQDQDQEQKQIQPQDNKDHFFSRLANMSLHHIWVKIFSHLAAKDVISCLCSCRALRNAVETLRLESELALEPKPKQVSDKFETSFVKWKEQFYKEQANFNKNNSDKIHLANFMYFLVQQANNKLDEEADRVLVNVNLEALAEPYFAISPELVFGKDWRGRIGQIVGISDPECTLIDHGNLVIVEVESSSITECFLVRFDRKEGNDGKIKIIDKWDYKKPSGSDVHRTKFEYHDCYLEGTSVRRENKVFYVCARWFNTSTSLFSSETATYCLALMVDLDKDKVVWKKKCKISGRWCVRKPFLTDKVCGFFVRLDNWLEVAGEFQDAFEESEVSLDICMKRFNVETGEEMKLLKNVVREIYSKVMVSSRNVLAMISENDDFTYCYQDSNSSFELLCQTFDTLAGAALRHYCLSIPYYKVPEGLPSWKLGFSRVHGYKMMPFWFAFFNGRVLAMCDTHVRGRNILDRSAKTRFVFWDLEEPMIQGVTFGLPRKDRRSFWDSMDRVADVVMGRVIWLDGLESVGPSATGNIWFLLSSEAADVEIGEDESEVGRVWHTLHAIDLAKSAGALRNFNRFHNF